MTNPVGWLFLIFGVAGLASSKLTEQRWRGMQWYPAAFGLVISIWSVSGLLSWFFADFRRIWTMDTPRRQCVFLAAASVLAGFYLLQETAVDRLLAGALGTPLIAIPLIIGTLIFFSCAVLRAVDSLRAGSHSPQQ